MSFLIGFILSLIIAGIAYKVKSLSLSGYIAAVVSGTLLYGFGTLIVFTLLITFFISSSLITKISNNKKKSRGRNYIQVIANSLIAIIFAIIYYFSKNHNMLLVAVIAIAATTSDTWGSEVGKFTKGRVVSVLNFKTITKGESGGISLPGTTASFLGSLLIGSFYVILAVIVFGYEESLIANGIIISIAGFFGSVIDSYLGILIQEKFIHKDSGKIVEEVDNRKFHKRKSGILYINNDVVNLMTTIIITTIFSLILI